MNRIFNTILLFLFCVVSGFGQFSGRIVDAEDGSPLQAVICAVVDENGNFLDFRISDAEGRFSLENRENASLITFSLLGYERVELRIEEITDRENMIVRMSMTADYLQEIVVTAPPIVVLGDTIRHRVGHFRQQEDRHLVDVLRRLPGITVSESGTISYQGEAISRFFIEGRDLLGGQYGVAVNNLNLDAVSSVEVLENNQHVRALQGVQPSTDVAINIRLDRNFRARPFGEVQLGAGGAPLLYDCRLFATYLAGNLQTMANFRINNTGDNILRELGNQLQAASPFAFELLLPENLITPSSFRHLPLDERRYLFNNSYLGSVHSLVPLSEFSEVRVNLSYGADAANQQFSLEQNFALGNDVLTIYEHSEQRKSSTNSRLAVTYQNNNPRSFIRNEMVYFNRNEKTRSDISSNIQDFRIDSENNPVYLQNIFETVHRFRNNRTITANSFVRYATNNEQLNAATDAVQNHINQLFQTSYFTNRNSIRTAFDFFGDRIDVEFGTLYRRRNLNNELSFNGFDNNELAVPLTSFQRNRTELLQFSVTPGYQFRINRNFRITVNLPVTYSRYSARNNDQSSFTDERVLFTPAVNGHYRINARWEANARLAYDFRYGSDISLLGSPFFRNYRTLYVPSGKINYSRNYIVSGRIRYRNIVNMLFFNLSVIYRNAGHNYTNVLYNTDRLSYFTTTQKNSTSSQLILNSDISKTIAPLRLTLTLNPSYTRMASQFIQQERLINNVGNAAALAFRAELRAVERAGIAYNAAGRGSWNRSNLADSPMLKALTQNLALQFFPNSQMNFSLSSSHNLLEVRENSYLSFFFLDASFRYRFRRMELNFSANNILNNDVFAVTHLSTINSFHQELPLRGREFLLTARFSF